MQKVRIIHYNRMECELDERRVMSADDNKFNMRLRQAIRAMTEENIFHPGDCIRIEDIS